LPVQLHNAEVLVLLPSHLVLGDIRLFSWI